MTKSKTFLCIACAALGSIICAYLISCGDETVNSFDLPDISVTNACVCPTPKPHGKGHND